MAASSSFLCLLRAGSGGGGILPGRASEEVLYSLILRIPSSSRRRYCSKRVGACATAAAKHPACLRSPDLVALEYADLNLPHKLSEVTSFHPSFHFCGYCCL